MTTEKIVNRLSEVSNIDTVQRVVELIPTNRYVLNALLKECPHIDIVQNPHADPFTYLKENAHNHIHHCEDIIYVEIPDDYGFDQHKTLSELLPLVSCGWVVYSRVGENIRQYYKYCRSSYDIFSNDILKPKHVGIKKHNHHYYISLGKIDYLTCHRAALNRYTINPEAERISKMGEMAFAKYAGLTVDFTRNRNTSAADFILPDGRTVKVKTFNNPENGKIISRAYNSEQHKESGIILPVTFDLYIGCFILNDDTENKTAMVGLSGFSTRDDMENKSVIENGYTDALRRGHWYNRQLHFRDLRPILELK